MKKKIIYLSIVLVLVISVVTLSSIYKSKDNKYKKEYNTIPKEMAIMIKEEGATDYIKSTSKDIPKGNYVLNRDKSYCKNNGKIGNYDSSLGKVSFSFIGTDSCYLYFDYEVPSRIGYEAILLDNSSGVTTVEEAKSQIESKPAPDFSTVTTASDKGMYSAPDDLGTSYYFRGAVDNNWVKYGKYTKDMYNCNDGTISATDTGNSCTKIASSGDAIYWRIIRINGDNSIRMIYSGVTPPTESTKVVMIGTGTQIGESAFNSSSDKAEYVGYMYTLGQQNGNSTDSTIKTTIDNWYKTTTLETDSATKALVSQNQIFCNDRSASSIQTDAWTSTANFYYGAYGRLNVNKMPLLTCPTESDKFTSKNSSIGNKALDYPVGLITADEVAMAGGAYNTRNSSYYLCTNQYYWSGSPFHFVDELFSSEFQVISSNDLLQGGVKGSIGVRPVISLSSKVKLLGNGTYNHVYTVVGGNSTEDTSSGKSFDTVFAANNTNIFSENGIRYEGADPNNYICLDNKTSGACSSSSLLFRIIGLFDEDTSSDGTSSSGTKKLLKVIDTNNYGGTSGKYWNSAGTNNWSTASLKTELNGTYLTTLLGTSNVNSKLSSAIVNTKWHLGGADSTNYNTLTADGVYNIERTDGKVYGTNPSSIYAKIGLMYPSDYGYATVGGTTTNKAGCGAKELFNWNDSSYSDCKNNDWLFTSQVVSWGSNKDEWLLSPYSSYSSNAATLNSSGHVNLRYSSIANNLYAVRPTFYLDSSVLKIVGTGDGTKDNAYRVG